MSVAAKLKTCLDEHGVEYTVSSHGAAYTAQEIAARAHIPGKELAKSVIACRGKDILMFVLAAPAKVDFEALSRALEGEEIRLATELEFKDLFPDCEVGAMPPFGNLYNLPVYVDETLQEDEEIAFNAGNHREVIRMKYQDFEQLVQPKHLKFAA